jgi:DNA-directed RNA polymerase specialized sigma24 family protein
MSGVLALLVADREERIAASVNGSTLAKTEVVLASAGLQPTEIAPMLGKNLGAVRKSIQRARTPRRKPKK